MAQIQFSLIKKTKIGRPRTLANPPLLYLQKTLIFASPSPILTPSFLKKETDCTCWRNSCDVLTMFQEAFVKKG